MLSWTMGSGKTSATGISKNGTAFPSRSLDDHVRTPGTILVLFWELRFPLKGIWVFSALGIFRAPSTILLRCPLQPPSNVSTDATASLSCIYKKATITTTKIVARHNSPSK
jgi:hypothetical protein